MQLSLDPTAKVSPSPEKRTVRIGRLASLASYLSVNVFSFNTAKAPCLLALMSLS
jgi:hypothetical protein